MREMALSVPNLNNNSSNNKATNKQENNTTKPHGFSECIYFKEGKKYEKISIEFNLVRILHA